jgi:hypothetical protein
VKRLLSLETMSQSLQAHKYRSMASFERDFYELLNNGRAVTAEDSQVRHVGYVDYGDYGEYLENEEFGENGNIQRIESM